MNILLTNYSIDHVFPANPNKRACLRTLHTIKSFTRHRMRGTQVSASATSQDLRKRGASFKMSVQCHKQKGKQPNGGGLPLEAWQQRPTWPQRHDGLPVRAGHQHAVMALRAGAAVCRAGMGLGLVAFCAVLCCVLVFVLDMR